MTGLEDIGLYFAKMLTIDAVFLNEDRHTQNIAVVMKGENQYLYCPFFDHGSSLLSDTTLDYPINEDVYKLTDSVSSKTISLSFDEQLETVESKFGTKLRFFFTKNDVKNILNAEPYYPADIKERVQSVIFDRMRKYGYLFD